MKGNAKKFVAGAAATAMSLCGLAFGVATANAATSGGTAVTTSTVRVHMV